MSRRLVVTAIIATSAILFSACGGSDTANSAATADTAAVAAPGIAFPSDEPSDQADVSFAQDMIPHHSQAVEMATLALDRSTNPATLDLAARIQGAQDPEIQKMRGWLVGWGEEEMSSDMEGMDHSSMAGMMDDAEMAALSNATGPAFDALFVDMMIRHHQGAITMAETVLSDGTDPEVLALAEAIIAAQAGEITEMQGLQLGQ